MAKRIAFLLGGALVINTVFVQIAFAHCPLCTVGAAAAAIGASWLGLSSFSIGIFMGAFALAMGLWIGKLLKRKFKLPAYIIWIFAIFSFVTTVVPLQPIMFDNSSIYVSIFGDYGSWLNSTYYVDKFVIGSIIGAVILVFSPYISRVLSKTRNNKTFPYQGMIITFGLLFVISLSLEILKWMKL